MKKMIIFSTLVINTFVIFLFLFFPKSAHAIDCSLIQMTISTPTAYQTYQRDPDKADIIISGGINDQTGTFLVRYQNITTILSGVSYSSPNKFSIALPNQPQGQDDLKIFWVKDKCIKIKKIPYIGIGDIFLVAGQSNHTSRGLYMHSYIHPTLKATLFGNDYKWKDLRDPTDSNINQVDIISSDNAARGSYLPLLATQIMALTKVPVAFIPTAKGGSCIDSWSRNSDNHFSRDTLYGSAAYRAKIQGSGKIKAILWWQGECDLTESKSALYKFNLINLANNFAEDLDPATPLIAYQLETILTRNGIPRPYQDAIRQSIREAAQESPSIILGPYLSDIDLRFPSLSITQGVHLVSNQQQQQVANRVFSILKNTIYTNQ